MVCVRKNKILSANACNLIKTNEYTIIKTPLFKYIETFVTKIGKFSDKKKSDIFPISAQNIDCG